MKGNFRHCKQEVTHYQNLQGELVSAEILASSLSAGSKKRLYQYMKNLTKSQGLTNRNFDKQVFEMLQRYVYDHREFDRQVEYLNGVTDKEGYLFSRNLKRFSMTEDAMQRFLAKDYTSFRWNENYQSALEEMKAEFRKLRLHPLHYNNDDDIVEALPKLDTHSGYTWILSGRKQKGENMEEIYTKFQKCLESVMSKGSFGSPILLGFRTQCSGEYDDDGTMTQTCKHKLRIVSMVDLLTIIGELMFSKPIQQYLAHVDYYAGGKDNYEISKIIGNWRMKYYRYLSIDYSSFDQTISSWLIEDAFSIIKSAFICNKEEDLIFKAVVHDFIHKDFILDGKIAHSDKGVPSGSMFTQIIDSIVNRLVITTYFKSIKCQADMMIMGDDNIIFTSSKVTLKELSSYVAKNFGLSVKTDDKSNEGSSRGSKGVKFLSRYWRWDGQWRHPNQLVSRLLYPERFRAYDELIGPQHVIFAFILTYGRGMEQLIDVRRFCADYPISKSFVYDKVGSRYLPGAMAYIREYT